MTMKRIVLSAMYLSTVHFHVMAQIEILVVKLLRRFAICFSAVYSWLVSSPSRRRIVDDGLLASKEREILEATRSLPPPPQSAVSQNEAATPTRWQ